MNRYSTTSDSHRWWWTSALAGTAAAALVAGLVAASSSTGMPATDTGAAGISANLAADARRSLDCPSPPDPAHVGAPWVPPVPTGCPSVDRWWKYVDLPGAGGDPSGRPRGRVHCPPAPDPVYVGAPWVPPVPTGCPSVDRWWKHVDLPE